jgi:hypothetical protein
MNTSSNCSCEHFRLSYSIYVSTLSDRHSNNFIYVYRYNATYRLANSKYASANDPIDNIYMCLFYTLYNDY